MTLNTPSQILNYGTYQALGKVGVYYGFKFGIDVPWFAHGP
jgi:hypothetical protein